MPAHFDLSTVADTDVVRRDYDLYLAHCGEHKHEFEDWLRGGARIVTHAEQ